MDIKVILLLIIAAVFHCTWNILVKKSSDKQVAIWLALVVFSIIFFIPLCIFIKPISLTGWVFIFLSALFEAIYFNLLGCAYRHGDLTSVYPLSRGLAPVFVTLIACIALNEIVTLKGFTGVILIVMGVYIVNVRTLDKEGLLAPFYALRQKASIYAIFTGLSTAGYTIIDKVGVRYVEPFILIYLKFLIACLVLIPYMIIKKREAVVMEWKKNKVRITAISILLTMAYLLVVISMTTSKVSYVSAVREVSIVFAAIIGSFYLKEKFAEKKIVGSVLVFAGIFLIAISK